MSTSILINRIPVAVKIVEVIVLSMSTVVSVGQDRVVVDDELVFSLDRQLKSVVFASIDQLLCFLEGQALE